MQWGQSSEPTALPEVGSVRAAGYSGPPCFAETEVTVESQISHEATLLQLDAGMKGTRGRVTCDAPDRRLPSNSHLASRTTQGDFRTYHQLERVVTVRSITGAESMPRLFFTKA